MAVKPRTAKPALALWLIDHRKALGMKPLDVAKAISGSDDTVRGWESGRGIGPDFLPALERLFGESAPASGADYASGDLTAAIGELVRALDADREERMALTRAIAALAGSLATRQGDEELPELLARRKTTG